ncbi:putative flavoprotein [Candidatus Methanoperedens nitroreducens]|uniref:Putative flavoprotein n=1 Tax=Candidatus Methanoperedens nitratireducens TaxID=1392998 RepID=A0A062UYH7_9EURY|nr:flavodoxin domain-containing protein [Candidatus Methanoperedens nitroreducens]KCZ71971.1 putative flavoprotein [Candidatus Methanoperedens nitroreducens]MDJ1422052.1 flavodoxin domain-containing protein [Candidatus Methanoperedens sp.]
MVVELKEGVYWVGVVDWNIKHFHGHEYSTHRGTTYNAYLIVDEKTALVDTVWGPYASEMIDNIEEITDIRNIDYVVANHAEVDHSGALTELMKFIPDATVVVSEKGRESVYKHHHRLWNFKVAGTGDTISLGENSLAFVSAPMLHWPDSMFTYLTGKNILMPNDAFGQHYASSGRFNDEVDQIEVYQEAIKYYANILTPFSDLVIRKIDELKRLNLPVDMIAPSHGVIWRKDPMQIVEKYYEWASGKNDGSVLVIYDTMWNATEKMAKAISEGLEKEGVKFRLFNMAVSDRNDVLTEVLKARGILIGSPALNNGLLPTIQPILEDLKGLKFKNKAGAAFGSYGWSGENIKHIEQNLEKARIPIVQEGLKIKWQPTKEELDRCVEFGRNFAKSLRSSEQISG